MELTLIRECTREDIDAVVALDREWEQENIAYGDFNPIGRDDFLAYLAQFPRYFLVAACDAEIVGYIHGTEHHTKRVAVIPEHEPYLEIENIYVKPGFRDGHIGGELLDRLLEAAEQCGIHKFLVSSSSKDTDRILKFYRSHGFTSWHVQLFR